MKYVTALLLTMFVAVNAFSHEGEKEGFKGVTTKVFTGGVGLGGFYKACQDEFGGNTLMCSTQQIVDSPQIGSHTLTGNAWVRTTDLSSGGDLVGANDFPPTVNCNRWTQSAAGQGLTITQIFGFKLVGCETKLPVACCFP